MKNDSSEQYLKYLAALALTVAAPAAAQSSVAPVAADEAASEKQAPLSTNLRALAGTPQNDELADGCMGWPESTYVRHVSNVRPVGERQAPVSTSLVQLVDDVMKKLD